MRSNLLLILLISTCWLAQGQTVASSGKNEALAAAPPAANPELFVRVQLDQIVKTSKLRAGDVVSGHLQRDVYSADRLLFPAGSQVRLSINKMEKRRREPDDHWPWVVKAFTPRHEMYPAAVSATVSSPGGSETTLDVDWFAMRRERQVAPPPATKQEQTAEKKKIKQQKSKANGAEQVVTLEAGVPGGTSVEMASAPRGALTLPAGTEGKVILLGDLSAGQNHAGDAFQAKLVEPIRLNADVVLPEGTLLQGMVTRRTPPRWLSRAGSLYLSFTGLQVPGGVTNAITASVTSAQLDQRSHTRIDREGELKGERPGKAWMMINVGVTAGIAKEVDDGTQLVMEALISTATDASTAGTARIVATCASGIFMITRHGRDVVLPRFTEMNIMLDRPVTLPATAPAEK